MDVLIQRHLTWPSCVSAKRLRLHPQFKGLFFILFTYINGSRKVPNPVIPDAFVITFSPTLVVCGIAVGSYQMIVHTRVWTVLERLPAEVCVRKPCCLVSFCLVILVCLLLYQHKQGAAGINFLVTLQLRLIVVRLAEHTGWSRRGIFAGLSRIHKFIKSMTEMRFHWDTESNLGRLVMLLWSVGWKNAPFEFEMKHTHTPSTWNICQMQR